MRHVLWVVAIMAIVIGPSPALGADRAAGAQRCPKVSPTAATNAPSKRCEPSRAARLIPFGAYGGIGSSSSTSDSLKVVVGVVVAVALLIMAYRVSQNPEFE